MLKFLDPRPVWRALDLLDKLGALYDNEADKKAWLTSPHPLLQGRVPMQMIGTREGYREVCAMLQAVLDGAFL